MKNTYRFESDYVVVDIYCKGERMECYVSREDFEKVNDFPNRWYARYEKTTKTYYVLGNLKGKTVYMHRYILDAPTGKVVDHRDFDTLNNRRLNIRVVDYNISNQHKQMQKNNKSGIRGVSWNKGKWEVRKQINGKRTFLGRCETLDEAKELLEKTL